MPRSELPPAQLARLPSLLPPARLRIGRPARDLAWTVLAILWVQRTGAHWRDTPSQYGPWQTAANRFYCWRRLGAWQRALDALQRAADEAGAVDWRLHMVDSTVVRVHQHPAGAKGGCWAKRSAARAAACRPRSMSAATEMGSHSRSTSRRGSGRIVRGCGRSLMPWLSDGSVVAGRAHALTA